MIISILVIIVNGAVFKLSHVYLIWLLSDSLKMVKFVMSENRILCPVVSVITGSPGRFFVPYIQCSQLINIVPSTTEDINMSGGEEAYNMFPTPATRGNLLQPRYYLNVPTYPIEEIDHRRNRDGPSLTPPSFTSFE